MPSNLATTNLGATTADITWTGGNGTFMYEYSAQGTFTTMSGSSSTAIASLTGLTPSTTYDFFVKEACGAGDTSLTMYHSFTTDSCVAVVLGNPQFNVDSVTATYAAITFNWNSNNATGFNISFGDGNSSNGTAGTVTHSYTSNGNYTVTLTVYNDCDTVNTTFSVQVSTIGIEDNAGITALMIYPNPTQGLVTIDGEISHSAEVSIRIINYLGQEILVDQFDPTSSVLSKTYDLSGAAAGAYLIEVATDRGVVQKSIIVRH
jgi:PKD repeat protein